MQATNFTFNKPLFDAKIEAAIASDAAAILPNLAEFTPALPELEPVTSHPLIEKLKITQHVWNSLFQPLLPKPFQSATIPTAQISWEFAANGDLVITLKDILDESLIDLKERLEQNHRLKDVQVNEQQLTLIMPNHYLLHLFFEKPQLLQEIYNLHPEIKGMHQSLLKGTPIDKLITNDLKTVQLFEKSSIPGDYIILKNFGGNYTIRYRQSNGSLHSFAFSNHFGSFSSFEGIEHLKRPFIFKRNSPGEVTQMHNAFLYFKNVSVVNSLKKYGGSETNNFCIGGIDALIELEDLLAWHDCLPDGKLKMDLFLEIIPYVSVLIAHFNSLKGQALSKNPKKINLEGMRRPPAKEEIIEAARRYLPRTEILTGHQRYIIFQMLRKAVRFSNKSDFVISNRTGFQGDAKRRFEKRNLEIIEDLNNGIPVSISTGWAKHNIEITLYKCKQGIFMLYTNKGATLHGDNKTRLYKVSTPITAEMIGHLRKRPNMGTLGEQLGTYFYAPESVLDTIKVQLGGTRPKTMIEEFGLTLVHMIKKKSQTAGNCSVANGKEMIYNAAYLLKFAELLAQQVEIKTAAAAAEKIPRHVSKEFQLNQRVYQMGVWKHLSKFLKDDPQLAKEHFMLYQSISTKYVNNKQKLENYKPFCNHPYSQIPAELDALKTSMRELVKASPCDIAECTGPIPFNTGSRINKGPNGSFGIYKSRYLDNPKPDKPVYHLVVKNLAGKFEIFEILKNPVKQGDFKDQGTYKIVLGPENSKNFNTLGELAGIMETQDHQMIFAL